MIRKQGAPAKILASVLCARAGKKMELYKMILKNRGRPSKIWRASSAPGGARGRKIYVEMARGHAHAFQRTRTPVPPGTNWLLPATRLNIRTPMRPYTVIDLSRSGPHPKDPSRSMGHTGAGPPVKGSGYLADTGGTADDLITFVPVHLFASLCESVLLTTCGSETLPRSPKAGPHKLKQGAV